MRISDWSSDVCSSDLYVRSDVLIAVFASVALLVAIFMATTRPHFRLRDGLPRGFGKIVCAVLMDATSAMMGNGGGTHGVPFMSACGYPVHRAVGTAAAIGFIIAVPASVGFIIAGRGDEAMPDLSIGLVSLLGVVLLTPLTTRAALWGARRTPAAPRTASA